MTDQTQEWADEIAREILIGPLTQPIEGFKRLSIANKLIPYHQKVIAAALRKAKADGLREAANHVSKAPTGGMQSWTANEIRIMADQIEKGET
jgi:hypothetical protein